jgi:hypothetical protein
MHLIVMLMSGSTIGAIAAMIVTLRGCPGGDRDAHHETADWRCGSKIL